MPASRAVRGCSIEKTYFYGTLCAYVIGVKRLPAVLASVVKWISHQPSKLLLGVRIPPEAPQSNFPIFPRLIRRRVAPQSTAGQGFRALRARPSGGSSQRFLWQQPFSLKGCYPLRF